MSKMVSTVVLTAAGTIDLTVLATFKDDWGITDGSTDAFLGRQITRSSAAVAQFCNRVIGLENVQDTFLLAKVNNRFPFAKEYSPLQLTRWPVTQIVSLTEDGTVLTENTDFITDKIAGQLMRLDSNGYETKWSNGNIVVVYWGGFQLPGQTGGTWPVGATPLPVDIQDAVGRLIYSRYAERVRDPMVKSITAYGIGTTEYFSADKDGAMPPDVEDLLDNYRARGFA